MNNKECEETTFKGRRCRNYKDIKEDGGTCLKFCQNTCPLWMNEAMIELRNYVLMQQGQYHSKNIVKLKELVFHFDIGSSISIEVIITAEYNNNPVTKSYGIKHILTTGNIGPKSEIDYYMTHRIYFNLHKLESITTSLPYPEIPFNRPINDETYFRGNDKMTGIVPFVLSILPETEKNKFMRFVEGDTKEGNTKEEDKCEPQFTSVGWNGPFNDPSGTMKYYEQTLKISDNAPPFMKNNSNDYNYNNNNNNNNNNNKSSWIDMTTITYGQHNTPVWYYTVPSTHTNTKVIVHNDYNGHSSNANTSSDGLLIVGAIIVLFSVAVGVGYLSYEAYERSHRPLELGGFNNPGLAQPRITDYMCKLWKHHGYLMTNVISREVQNKSFFEEIKTFIFGGGSVDESTNNFNFTKKQPTKKKRTYKKRKPSSTKKKTRKRNRNT